jgi:ADP-ribosyl-[dinitrogen reductase] hydrolase
LKNRLDKALGGFLGLAIGDALGAQVEFKAPGSFPKVSEMTGGGVFNLLPGQITDDTTMSILVAKSLIECEGFDPRDMMRLFYDWSSSPACFDIGNTIQDAIYAFKRTGDPFQGLEDDNFSGNGSLMRIYPAILWTLDRDEEEAFELVWDMSRLTHSSQIVYEVSFHFFQLIRTIFLNELKSKKDLIQHFEPIINPKSTGFILDTFQVALWGFVESESFEEGLLKVVNLGGDADTAGSVYGQLAGSFYGVHSLPDRFLGQIREVDQITSLTQKLLKPKKTI